MTQIVAGLLQNETPQIDMNENRLDRRRRVLKCGTMHFNKGHSTYDCNVCDLSDMGAMLEVGDVHRVPNSFDFQMPGDAKPRNAQVVWKKNKNIGIRFS